MTELNDIEFSQIGTTTDAGAIQVFESDTGLYAVTTHRVMHTDGEAVYLSDAPETLRELADMIEKHEGGNSE